MVSLLECPFSSERWLFCCICIAFRLVCDLIACYAYKTNMNWYKLTDAWVTRVNNWPFLKGFFDCASWWASWNAPFLVKDDYFAAFVLLFDSSMTMRVLSSLHVHKNNMSWCKLRDTWVITVNNWPFLGGLIRQWWQKSSIVDTRYAVVCVLHAYEVRLLDWMKVRSAVVGADLDGMCDVQLVI